MGIPENNKMKLVFFAPFGIRPKGTLLARMLPLAVELRARGHAVTVIAPPYTNPEDSGVTETVEGVRLVNVRLSGLGNVLGAPLLAWRMFRAMRKEKPDLVHLFKPKGYGGLAAMLMFVLARMGMKMPPFFVDTDDWEGAGGMNDLHGYSLPAKWLYAFQEKWLPRQAAGVTVASRALEERITSFGVSENRAFYLPNCIADVPGGSGDKVREELGIAAETPVVLLYTRFFEFPQEQLHAVFEGIARDVPEVRFLVVGKGRFGEDEKLKKAGAERGFAEKLVQVGWVEPENIPGLLTEADVAIYPFSDTLLNRCKCPAKLTEIIRAGVPVVADAVGQIKEYLRPGEGGTLCTSGNVDEMISGVLDLIARPDERARMGAAGREYLVGNFNWQDTASKLDGFYREHLD